jgi:PLD-like domain
MHNRVNVATYAMRIQARPGSPVEKSHYANSSLPGQAWPNPKAIADGIAPSPLDDLIFHGGRVVPQMGFQNIYLGSSADWASSDIALIDAAITRAMQDKRLNDIMGQYFPGTQVTCDEKPSVMLHEAKPLQLDEPDVQAKVVQLFNASTLGTQDLGTTLFNLLLPPGTVLKLGASSSPDGLGGYHGSVHTKKNGKSATLYYSANVYSQMLADRTENGIVAFDQSWKNVVATLYHELNEFRTDADVKDAIESANNDFLGWMSRQGRECGDQPIAVATSLNQVFQEVLASNGGDRIPVQFMYSNRVHGAEAPSADAATTAAVPAPDPATHAFMTPSATVIDQVISQHLGDLAKPGVLSVRPGYQMAGGWLTKKPAIVVTVDKKADDVPPADRLPETLGGFAVDVREAGPMERLRAQNPSLYVAVAAQAAPELALPQFALERDLTGRRLAPLEEAAAAARAPAKPNLPYTPPANAPLQAIVDTFTVTCHASPDAGWPQLKSFFTGVKSRLTVGMYDFTSAHILQTLQASLTAKKHLNLVLDHPAADRTLDQTDAETRDALAASLGSRLQFAWALEERDPQAAAWIFPSAYHIKVAVRDGTAFWLSSGNWNNSNQPDIDPVNDPAGAQSTLKVSDRDWHVMVEHPALAALFEHYLQNDLTVASQHQAPAAVAASLDALSTLAAPELPAASRVPQQFFAPKTITARMKIQPVLTPDNYANVILALIASATRTLYVQIPYITPSDKPEGVTLAGLIEAIAKKVRAGLDVRLILSGFATAGALEQLQAAGIDGNLIRIQNNLHNKGFVVDSSVVAVGSQNWSPPGVTTNRDASLVIFNAEAAQYWESIFLHDWAHMAVQHLKN